MSSTPTVYLRGSQAAVSQHEHNEAVITQRLQEAGEAIASHEEMADALTREIHDLRSANEGGDSAYAALRHDLEIAQDTVAAHEGVAGDVKVFLARVQARNADLGEL